MPYQIHRLNFGSVHIDESMRLRGTPPGNKISVPAQGFLLSGPAGPILVDAGYRDPSVLGAGGEVAAPPRQQVICLPERRLGGLPAGDRPLPTVAEYDDLLGKASS